jgi:carboxypeptidase Taq
VLEEWVALVKETSALIDPWRPAYDVALEEFEKGMTSARIDEIFTQVCYWCKPKICTWG